VRHAVRRPVWCVVALASTALLALPACSTRTSDRSNRDTGAAVGISHTGCPPETSNGSGIIIEPGIVLTAAHVLKGADEIVVTNVGNTTTGTIVAFDPEMDLALLQLAEPIGSAVPMADLTEIEEPDIEGATGVAFVMRNGEVRELPVTVRRKINLRTEDIYIDGEYERPAWELDADTNAGDSGGAVVVNDRVIGVLSLRSNRYESRAYAIDPVRGGTTIRDQRATGTLGDVDLSRCT
jgi:S1-C subfamily serine protease